MKDCYSVQEVEYAVLETDGLLSVLKKSAYQTPTKKDLNVFPSEPQIAIPLIMDKEIIKDHLEEADVTDEWLYDEIKRQDYQFEHKILYAEWLEDKKLFILPYRKIKHKQMEKKLK